MTDYPETTPFVYVSGGGTASGRPAADSTASPDSLATIIRDCVVLSIAPEILEMQIEAAEREDKPRLKGRCT